VRNQLVKSAEYNETRDIMYISIDNVLALVPVVHKERMVI